MPDFHFYEFDSDQYAADFQTLLRCYRQQETTDALLEELLAPHGRQSIAVDWGAGSGFLTSRLLKHFDTVYAVEPSPAMRAVLQRDCPGARLIAGTITEADVPAQIDVGFIRHVFYHVPDHKWGAYTLRAAARLAPGGLLVVTLGHPQACSNDMIEAFGGPRFNLFCLDDTLRRHPEFRVEHVAVSGPIVTTTFADTLAIVRFLLADRPPDAYARTFTQEEVEAYVRQHLWDETTQTGSWRGDSLWILIRRNPFWRK